MVHIGMVESLFILIWVWVTQRGLFEKENEKQKQKEKSYFAHFLRYFLSFSLFFDLTDPAYTL